LWGFANLAIGFLLVWEFFPKGAEVVLEWALVGLGILIAALLLAWRFGSVRSKRQ
jgi:membrane protein DedA with SNARE-associated domain